MNELLKIEINDNDEQVISGRALHSFLEVKDKYPQWFGRMTEYGFTEGQDFITILGKSSGGRPSQDHAVKIDMAKEIAMIQRTEKGKSARRFFIEVEKAWNDPVLIMGRALEATKKVNFKLESRIAEMKPKALFADSVASSESSILVREMATILCQNGIDIGEKRLFNWLRKYGYLIKRTVGSDFNMPTQKSMRLGLFEIKEGTRLSGDGKVKITKTAKVTGKGQTYFVNKFLGGVPLEEPLPF